MQNVRIAVCFLSIKLTRKVNLLLIKCSTFQESKAIIKKSEDKIKETGSIKERQYYAQDILLEVESLMPCSNYNGKNQDCLNCHLVLLNYIREYKHLAEDEIKKPLVS